MKKNEGFKNLGLRTKLVFAFIASWLFGCSCLTVSMYQVMLLQHHENIRTRLHDYVAIAAMTIDPEEHALLQKPEDENSAAYKHIVENLRTVRNSISDIKFVYTARLNNEGKVTFITDAEENEKEKSHLGDVFKDSAEGLVAALKSNNGPVVEADFITDKWGTFLSAYAPILTKNGRLDGVVAMDISLATVQKETQSLLFWAIGVSAIVSIIIILLALVIVRTITRPIQKAADMLKDIAEGEGDLTKRLHITTRDELGTLAMWFNSFLDNLQKIIREISSHALVVDGSSGKLLNIASALAKNAGESSSKAANVASASNEMTLNMQRVAITMEENTNNTSMVAAAVEEMSATINEIAQNSEKARSISESAVQQAGIASAKMADLGKAANAISAVTETITEISEQTNLLALNATIEAARAGESGRGFAVVANEIKVLARQTAAATAEIKGKIEGVQGTTRETISEIESIAAIIHNINEIISTIATAVEEQSVATNEISNNVTQTSEGINEVNQNIAEGTEVIAQISSEIAELNRSAGDISHNSKNIETNADELRLLAAQLNTVISRFKF